MEMATLSSTLLTIIVGVPGIDFSCDGSCVVKDFIVTVGYGIYSSYDREPLWHTLAKEAILSICIRKIFALHLRMRAKVINIKTRKPVFTKTLVTRDEFFDMADAVKDTLAELRNIDISTAIKILN